MTGALLSIYIISPENFLISGFATPLINAWPKDSLLWPIVIDSALNVVSTSKLSTVWPGTIWVAPVIAVATPTKLRSS